MSYKIITGRKVDYFRSMTFIDDTDTCIEILSAHNWDLMSAISWYVNKCSTISGDQRPSISTASDSDSELNNDPLGINRPSVAGSEAVLFLNEFEREYGRSRKRPNFVSEGFEDALQRSRREGKLMFVYLHSPEHCDVELFCESTLCDERLVEFLNENFVIWGASMKSSQGLNMANTLKASAYPFCALVKMSTDQKIVILQKVEGIKSPEELREILQIIQEECVPVPVLARIEDEERNEERDAASLEADQARERQRNEDLERLEREGMILEQKALSPAAEYARGKLSLPLKEAGLHPERVQEESAPVYFLARTEDKERREERGEASLEADADQRVQEESAPVYYFLARTKDKERREERDEASLEADGDQRVQEESFPVYFLARIEDKEGREERDEASLEADQGWERHRKVDQELLELDAVEDVMKSKEAEALDRAEATLAKILEQKALSIYAEPDEGPDATQALECQREEEQERLEREAAEVERRRKEEEESAVQDAVLVKILELNSLLGERAERKSLSLGELLEQKASSLGADSDEGPDVTKLEILEHEAFESERKRKEEEIAAGEAKILEQKALRDEKMLMWWWSCFHLGTRRQRLC